MMTRVALDLDPRLLTRLRALAKRRGVTVDAVVGEFVAAGLRSPSARRPPPQPAPSQRPVTSRFGPIDVDYPDTDTDTPDNDTGELGQSPGGRPGDS